MVGLCRQGRVHARGIRHGDKTWFMVEIVFQHCDQHPRLLGTGLEVVEPNAGQRDEAVEAVVVASKMGEYLQGRDLRLFCI